MKFEEALPELLDEKVIKIKNQKWCLTLEWDKNIQDETIYLATNDFIQGWVPQKDQLLNQEWEILE